MLFREAIEIAIQSLRANKLRSLLTVLGILIGVSSVIDTVKMSCYCLPTVDRMCRCVAMA